MSNDLNVSIGSVIRMPSFQSHGGFGYVNYKAPKGEHFVMILLGSHKLGSDTPFETNKVLEKMGWKFVGNDEISS